MYDPISYSFCAIYAYPVRNAQCRSLNTAYLRSNRKYPPFPLLSFFRGCVPEMFVTSYCHLYCIYVPGKPGICFHYHCAVYDECKYSDTFWLADRTCLFVQYFISLSSLCKLIWRHLTYKMPQIYFVECASKIKHILSLIHYTICGVFFSLPISLVMIDRIFILCLIIIIISEVLTITQCLGLGHETMVSAICLSIFLRLKTTDINNHHSLW